MILNWSYFLLIVIHYKSVSLRNFVMRVKSKERNVKHTKQILYGRKNYVRIKVSLIIMNSLHIKKS
jgi:hypothetical protein